MDKKHPKEKHECKNEHEEKHDCDCKKEEQKQECKCEKDLLKEKDARIEQLIIDLKRLQAEFENYQKRSEKQNNEFKQFANANIMLELLPVIDSLKQGIKHNEDFVPVYEQLNSILKKNGLSQIDVNVGDEFDHDTMECLMQEESKIAEGKVAQVLSTGYMLKDKILRTTKISISKKIENKEKKEEN